MALAETRRGQHPPNFGKTYPAEVLTPDEIGRLIATCAYRGPSGIRNRALIVTLWRGGLRISEALALEPKDIDAQLGTITILHGKRDKRRTVGIDPASMAVIARWLEVRRQLGVGGGRRVFCTIAHDSLGGPGRPVRPAYVRSMLKRVANKAGVEKRVHPHGLRHTHAHELAFEGQPVTTIRDQLGHTSIAVTDRYLRNIAPALVVGAMQARPWPSQVDPSARNTTPSG